MDLTITFNLDNAAFEDGAEFEASNILRALAHGIEGLVDMAGHDIDTPIRDSNGNTCGRLAITH